ncbi:little elongation complex subunit 1 [Lucilia sericata]|uniref:little elongation complex subunit 1 n=1 Tax=Lucilia sericata TaxID=13632 RepID=UPI0018A81A3A|nr:little elongation complex subunit 1 [Lucilia sericata]
MEELNLDFLKTPPKQGHSVPRIQTPCNYNALDVRFSKKKPASRKFEMAQTIAKVDELLQEIDKLRSQNNGLQERLKDFQQTAQQVQQLYNKEKHEHAKAKQNLEKLQVEYDKIDEDLTNKTLMNEQMKARLAQYDGRPINFDNLVVKYVRMMKKLEAEDILKYLPDKDLVERLKEYCATMKLKIAPISSPKKGKTRSNKIKTQEMFIQCDLLKSAAVCLNCSNKPKMQDQNIQCSTPPAIKHDQTTQFTSSAKQECLTCNNKPKLKDQNTQCSTTTTTATKRDQASQYISTMITRQTNTEKIVQKHVQTMFPEPQKIPAIDDILNVYSRWSNIRSVSPLLESPPSRIKKDNNKKSINTGTCTMLCNIRRKIDYLPPNQANNIKQEIITPSASPTPNTNPITASNRSRISSLSSQVASNQYASSILNLFNANTNSALGQLSSNAFNELWQIFGKMLLSLLQTSNAGIANTNQNSALNQQQFLDWLLDLYVNSQPPNTSTIETQTLQQMDNSNDSRRSPIRFNESSVLSTNVVRPEAQKILTARTNTGEGESVEPLRGDSIRENSHHIQLQRASISPIPTSITTSSVLLENYSQDSNSMDREIQQIHNASNTTEVHTPSKKSNITDEENTLKPHKKSSNKPKTKHKLLEEIQELIPELNLNKKKRKALKRLLKTKDHRKKSHETRKSKHSKADINKQPSVVVLSNETIPNESEETAVDFLKTFALKQEENISETEKIFLEQSSIKEKEKIQEEFTFIKPSSSLPRTKLTTRNDKDSERKRKKSKACKNIADKYQLLFGDSDSEIEELEMEENNAKTVIKTKLNLSEEAYKEDININDNFTEYTTNWSNAEVINSTNLSQTNGYEESYDSKACSDYESCHLTLRQTPEQQFSLPILNTPVFEMSLDGCENIPERFTIPDLPTPLLKRLECEHLPQMELFANVKDSIESDVRLREIEQDLQISSDDYNCKADVTETNNDNLVNNEIEVPNVGLKQTQVIATQTSTEESCTNTTKLKETTKIVCVENSINCLPNLSDDTAAENGCIVESQQQDFNNSAMYASDFEKDLELSSDNESQKELSNAPLYCSNFEKDLELSSDNESQRDVSNAPMYISDFEKDLELSSDNESLINESFCNDTKEINQELEQELSNQSCNKTLAATTSTESDDDERISNESEESEIPKESFNQTFDSNISTDSNEKRISKEKEECESPSKFLEQTKGKPIEGGAYHHLLQEVDNNFDVNTKSAQEVINNDSCNPSPSNLDKSNSIKEHSLSCSVITKNDSTIIDKIELTKSPEGTGYNPLKLSAVEENNPKFLQQTENNLKVNRTFTQELIEADSTTSSTSNLEKTNSREENSLCWSVITINDSTVKDNTLNKTELPKTPEKKSVKEAGDKVKSSGLTKLKLLDLNNSITKEIGESMKPFGKVLKSPEYKRNSNRTFEKDLINNQDHLKPPEGNLSTVQRNSINFENEVSKLNKELILNTSLDTEDETDELMIDEDQNDSNSKETNTELMKSNENSDETINSSNISTLLNSSLYNEVLTESLNPIVDDLLKNDVMEPDNKPKRGRKRKSECLAEVIPCKRSQRLKAKQMILEESLNLSKTPIKLGKYTKINKNVNNVLKEEAKTKIVKMKSETSETNCKLKENEAAIEMGFFRERLTEDNKDIKKLENHKSFLENEMEPTLEKSELDESNSLNITKMSIDTNDLRDTEQKALELTCHYQHTSTTATKDTNFVYSDSPQSPPPPPPSTLESNNETSVNIPSERLSPFKPQTNNQTLFDVLIDSYRNDNQKHVIESLSTKESQRQKNLLTQYHKEINAFCYSEMELDPNCTSIRLINKLLSISPDYGLIQKTLITIAQNSEGTNVQENELPSIIQEMPPRHLSKCLQRLFALLSHLTARNARFCQDLIDKIELLLFNWKQMENLSLQATLNLTQLYLMACKVQEYVQMPKHPARLFIAKCLYFYLLKSTLMIHEVLMWYPTVLPHREDKTYDRSDALISVIQQILMSTKYDMDKPDLRGKSLLSKLRYEYHFEPFKPALEEVINVLVEKLKNSKFYNISLAFGLLCKRLGVPRTQQLILGQHLLPLVNEYYSLALKSTEYDKRIAVLLEIISMIVKPFPVETDAKIYFNEFARFLNGFERQLIQEAALCSILRLQRFDLEYCYNLLCHFQPTYDLNTHTQAMLKTFLHRRPLNYWKNLKSKYPN